jgi:hypothetical protein
MMVEKRRFLRANLAGMTDRFALKKFSCLTG